MFDDLSNFSQNNQLADGSTIQRTTSSPMAFQDYDIDDVASGIYTTLVIRKDRTLQSIGYNGVRFFIKFNVVESMENLELGLL
jgi:hypothetical protein